MRSPIDEQANRGTDARCFAAHSYEEALAINRGVRGDSVRERERQLLEERNRLIDRMAELNLERRELQDRLTLIELELGL